MGGKWKINFVNDASESEVMALSPTLRAKFLRISDLLTLFGATNVGMPHVRPLIKGLWEIRISDKDNIARSIYIVERKQTVLILHTFIKKSQKTPAKAIATALKRLKECEYEDKI